MVSRSPTAISKAAAIRRRNHQLPRKRPTQLPPPKSTTRGIARPIPIPKPRKPSARAPTTKKTPCDQLRRGKERTPVAGSDSATQNQWPVRRILASRRKPNDSSILEYKIQWETTWEEAATIKGLAIEEWHDAIDADETFTYVAQDGSHWKVLKDSHHWENDSEDSQWEMWKAIRRNVIEEAKKSWLATLKETDYVYASELDEKKARQIGMANGMREPSSTLEVLLTAERYLKDDPQLMDGNMLYGDVKLRYHEQLDPWYDEENNARSATTRPALTVANILRTIHSYPLDNLTEDALSKDHGTYANCAHWREVMIHLIRSTPFMFKSGTWMQLFASLLLGGNILKTELASVGVEVQDDWAFRAREYAMHMYYDRIVDDRPIHDIQETFLSLREFFRELKPEDEIEEAPTSVRSTSHNVDSTIAMQESRAFHKSKLDELRHHKPAAQSTRNMSRQLSNLPHGVNIEESKPAPHGFGIGPSVPLTLEAFGSHHGSRQRQGGWNTAGDEKQQIQDSASIQMSTKEERQELENRLAYLIGKEILEHRVARAQHTNPGRKETDEESTIEPARGAKRSFVAMFEETNYSESKIARHE